MKESIFTAIKIEEDLRVLEPNEILNALFDKERAKNIKADRIALDVRPHAL